MMPLLTFLMVSIVMHVVDFFLAADSSSCKYD